MKTVKINKVLNKEEGSEESTWGIYNSNWKSEYLTEFLWGNEKPRGVIRANNEEV